MTLSAACGNTIRNRRGGLPAANAAKYLAGAKRFSCPRRRHNSMAVSATPRNINVERYLREVMIPASRRSARSSFSAFIGEKCLGWEIIG